MDCFYSHGYLWLLAPTAETRMVRTSLTLYRSADKGKTWLACDAIGDTVGNNSYSCIVPREMGVEGAMCHGGRYASYITMPDLFAGLPGIRRFTAV